MLRIALSASATLLAAVVFPRPSLPAAEPDLDAGRQAYAKCVACHSPERNRTGPRHCGLIGRVSGTLRGYDYSEAMRDAAILWTPETLDRFLAEPLAMLPGTTMGFAGVNDEKERRNLVAWLATLDDKSAFCNALAQDQPGATVR